MALFGSSNPTFRDGVFNRTEKSATGVMTVNGTIMKTFLLLGMLSIAALVTWRIAMTGIAAGGAAVSPWLIGGAIGGFIVALIISFKPTTAPFLAPVYAALEGLFLGGISAMFENMFPGIATMAVGITLLTTLVLLVVYRSGLIKVTKRFRSVIIIATMSVAGFYLIAMVLGLFNINLPFMHDSSLLGIGISVVVVVIAALNLLLDFDFIEKGAAQGAPKHMEWYGAFGLLVTLVWLYLEILKLLARLSNRN